MTTENIKYAFEGAKEKGANAIHAIQDPEFRGRVSNLVSSTYTSSKRAIESLIFDENQVENPLAPDEPVVQETEEPAQPEAEPQQEVKHSKIYIPKSQLKSDDLFEEIEDENEEVEAEGKMDLSIRETKS